MRRIAIIAVLAGCQFEAGTARIAEDAATDTMTTHDASTDGRPPFDAETDAPQMVPDCPADYTLTLATSPFSKYRHVTASQTWLGAEQDCEDDGSGTMPSHLLVPDDELELAFVFDEGTSAKWIGVTDRRTEGVLRAVNGASQFEAGIVSGNNPPKDCVLVIGSGSTMLTCEDGRPYICECDGHAANPNTY